MSAFIGSPSYSNGVLTLSIPKDAVKARYAFLQRLVLDLDVMRRLADMLALMEDNQGLEELSVPALGTSIHALADRSLDRILSGLCEEYSLTTDPNKESAKGGSEVAEPLSNEAAQHRAIANDALEDFIFNDPVVKAISNSRKIEALGKSLVQMSDSELQNTSALLDNNSEDLLVMADMIVTLAREINELLDQPEGGDA